MQLDTNGQSSLDGLLKAADRVFGAIDEGELRTFVARKNPEEGPGAKARREACTAQLTAMQAALTAVAKARIDEDIKVSRHPLGKDGQWNLSCTKFLQYTIYPHLWGRCV